MKFSTAAMSKAETSLRTSPSAVPGWLGLLLWLGLSMATGAIGAIASVDAKEFYASLSQPDWAPPAGVFGPVWTSLYVLMGVAAWLVWRERGWSRAAGALGLFVLQLAVNATWSWLFFAWHQGGMAFANILALWGLILATLVSFARVRRLAALLLLPYLLWVTFAAALNWSVWQRNPLLL